MIYYPDRIADDSDDDLLTSCSAVVETGSGVQITSTDEYVRNQDGKSHPWKRKNSENYSDEDFHEDDNGSLGHGISRHGAHEGSVDAEEKNNQNQMDSNREVNVTKRRVETQNSNETSQEHNRKNEAENFNSSSNNNLLGNIRGWFGGGNAGNNSISNNSNQQRSGYTPQQSPPVTSPLRNTTVSHRARDGYAQSEDGSSTTSSNDFSSSDEDTSTGDSEQIYAEEELTPQERARIRALRYLSNSCVDLGRKAKTASYVRSLERLDLKRKRDRLEKELEVMEMEMNKDRGMISNLESDCVAVVATKLVCELPIISSDAASSDGESNFQLTTYDEFNNDPNNDPSSLWENKEARDTYISSLQSRLKESLEGTRSQEKRLAILEKAGDKIIMSLCEDLVDVTSDANKAEARYVKKGKSLQMQRKRVKLRYNQKIKKAEHHVRHLEEQLLNAGERTRQPKIVQSTWSTDSSGSSDDEQDNDEVRLESKLSSIKSKNEASKADHKAEMESLRRQCEQLKLQISVALLVMQGDENLREYIAILGRAQSNLQDHGEDIPIPPQRITRARSKLLKVAHLQHIYEERLHISKAFSDATIYALEQELIERETSGQQMEVKCLNDLVAIECDTKTLIKDAEDKVAKLEAEARELEETVAACDENSTITTRESKSVPTADDDTSSESFDDETTDNLQSTTVDSQISVDSDNESVRYDPRNNVTDLESDISSSKHAFISDGDTRSSSGGAIDDANSDHNTPIDCSEKGDLHVEKQSPSKVVYGTKTESNLNAIDVLGKNLKDALSQYQRSRDSTSAERIKHLKNMNTLVIEIAKAKGIDVESTPKIERIESWRSNRKKPEREKKRRPGKEKNRRRRRENGHKKEDRSISLVW